MNKLYIQQALISRLVSNFKIFFVHDKILNLENFRVCICKQIRMLILEVNAFLETTNNP